MREKLLDEEESRVYKQILEKQQEEQERQVCMMGIYHNQSQKRSEASTDKTASSTDSVWDAPTPSWILL